MSSLNTSYRLPARPSDESQSRKSEDDTLRAAIPRSMMRAASESTETSPSEKQTSALHHSATESGGNSRSRGPIVRPSSSMQNKTCCTCETTSSENKRSHAQAASGSSSSSRTFDSTAFSIRKPHGQPAAIYPELDRYRDFQRPEHSLEAHELDVPYRLATHDLPPPTPASPWFSGSSQVSAASGSPSTKFSESPGPGTYSRDTTPTSVSVSVSSQSPAVVAPNRVGTVVRTIRQHSTSLARPPVTRRHAGSFCNEIDVELRDPTGLASVRESLTSSSSNSTVKDGEDRAVRKQKRNEGRLPPPSPTLPPTVTSPRLRQPKDISENRHMTSVQSGRTREFLPFPPARPSRQNTPNLKSQLSIATPIIQSNLSSITRNAEECGSRPIGYTPPSTSATSLLKNREKTSTPVLSFLERGGTCTSPKSSSRVEWQHGSATEPAIPIEDSQVHIRTSSRTRFPFFGRKKLSSDGAAKINEKAEKKNTGRKGPVAGTGHEGYGPVGAVRRRSGSGSALPHKAISSQSSYDSATSEPFLVDRVNPIIIPGGGISENRNTDLSRSEPSRGVFPRPGMDSKSSLEALPMTRTTNSLIGTSPIHLSQADRTPRSSACDGFTSGDIVVQSTLASRPLSQGPRSVPDIISSRHAPSTSTLTSFDTSILSEESYPHLQQAASEEPSASQPELKKLARKPLSLRKWNIFRRSPNQSNAKGKPKEHVAATVQAVQKRPLAFYTMIDAADRDGGKQASHADIQQVLREADVDSQTGNKGGAADTSFALPSDSKQSRQSSAEDEPNMETASSSLAAGSAHATPNRRPSRLPQVGRIPPVVRNNWEISSSQNFQRSHRASLHLPARDTIKTCCYPQSIAATSLVPSTSPNLVSQLSMENLILDEGRNNAVCNMNSATVNSPFATATAIIPRPEDPPIEDEVWDEYNDLLDGSVTRPPSATSSDGIPFRLETYQNKLVRQEAVVAQLPDPPVTAQDESQSSEHVRCRQASSKGHSLSSCGTSFSDCSVGSSDDTHLAQVNLRVGSMTVSKWLTFGHVLFSEVRHRLDPLENPAENLSVLVIDGLGNDDWSFYAAETYPSASFYNLSPRAAPAPEMLSQKKYPASPPNHHQTEYHSHLEKFPFPSQSFDAVVYRFPSVAPDSHHLNILSEARRVLRPDGYLELSILDCDLNNMGSRGRHTVRFLKERIRLQNPDTSIASTADLIVCLLGRVGFVNIRSARVGVPLGSSIPQLCTQKESSGSDKKGLQSLTNVSDNSPSADENITKMVTRVGRWWYTRCYEKVAGLAQDKGIWSDLSLLSECDLLGTSLKLTVCCARAPGRDRFDCDAVAG